MSFSDQFNPDPLDPNRFKPNQSNPNQFDPNQFNPNQFNPNQFNPNQFQQPPRGNSTSKVLIIVAVVVGVLALGCCGLCGGAFYLFSGEIARQVEDELRYNPVIVEHIGEIEGLTTNWTASLNEPDEDTFVYDIRGDKGSGQVTVTLITIDWDWETKEIVAGTLRMSTGEEYDLMSGDAEDFGISSLEEQVEVELVDNPVIVEHIGEIQSFTIDDVASEEEPDEDTFVYDIRGDKGYGKATVKSITIDMETEEVVAGTLRMSTGEEYDLMPDGVDVDMDF